MLTTKKVTIVTVLSLVLILTALSLWFYFQIYLKQSPYSDVQNTLSNENYVKEGFMEIKLEDSSFYVPASWTVIDKNKNIYSNLLNGSNSYLSRVPNTLGVLNPDVCKNISEKAIAKIDETEVYSNTKLVSFKIEKKGNYEGCIAEYQTSVSGKIYKFNQFYIFRKDWTYIATYVHLNGLNSEEKNKDRVFESIYIK